MSVGGLAASLLGQDGQQLKNNQIQFLNAMSIGGLAASLLGQDGQQLKNNQIQYLNTMSIGGLAASLLSQDGQQPRSAVRNKIPERHVCWRPGGQSAWPGRPAAPAAALCC